MFVHLFIGILGSFMGTLAIGPANLGVINITMHYNARIATRFSLGVAMVEVMYATAAILSGRLIVNKIDEYPFIKILVILFFFFAGIYYLIKKDDMSAEDDDQPVKKSYFLKGLIIGIVNPQTIPYWLFITTYLTAHHLIQLTSLHMIFFLVGGFTGKYLSLSLYGLLSTHIKKRSTSFAFYLNKFIGLTLIVIAVLQAIQMY